MKIAFCLINYFPYGGLQRDFLRIAKECVRRGHEVVVYTTRWEGPAEPDLYVKVLKVKGLTNHARATSFADQVGELLAVGERPLVVGFNKMPHLDLYYAADVCYQARIHATRSRWYRLMPRYRVWTELEEAVFQSGAHTDILLISALQQAPYTQYYHTEAHRFHLLPPGIARDRLAPSDAAQQRSVMRETLGLTENEQMLLMVGSGYQTKGLDRAIASLASLPAHCHLYVVGKGDADTYIKQARAEGVADRLHIMGARPEVPAFLLAADLLLHPSYHENTGTAILEALAAGLPVITTAVCGYAHYVLDANAGVVLPAAFEQSTWNAALVEMLASSHLKQWGENGLAFAKTADLYSMPERAVDLIEKRVMQ
jgi:UDP-glucose:(heptosyl)LPS alpha-1,3-glucosyltransferase